MAQQQKFLFGIKCDSFCTLRAHQGHDGAAGADGVRQQPVAGGEVGQFAGRNDGEGDGCDGRVNTTARQAGATPSSRFCQVL
ncbi:hypothetical protein [Massilia sp. PWRC2]|uniref:hypothetical protein n=1 Tax=Massilia sp. PWRC2 TaxID=2804626 RepID=UPI003CFAB34C